MESALKECFGERRLSECIKRLVIPSYNISDDDVYLFKTPHHERLRRDYKVPVWKVAMATSAAPTYFPTFKEVDNIRLIDGGIWANNPIAVGITEAVSLLNINLKDISVLSIGTTDELKGRPKNLDHGGLFQWCMQAVDVILRGQGIGANTLAQHLLGKSKIERIDPKVPDGLFKLDKLSEEELISKAAHNSRHFSPMFKEKFMSHISSEFVPFHKYKGVEQ